ncbi:DUF2937 family protein [Pseudoalteromonas espejiana]
MLLGVQIPAFVSDYGHALNAHLLEANKAIAPFKNDAKQYFNNDINKLINHYQNIGDSIVGKGANHINTLNNREKSLQAAVNAYNKAPYLYTLTSDFSSIKSKYGSALKGKLYSKKIL